MFTGGPTLGWSWGGCSIPLSCFLSFLILLSPTDWGRRVKCCYLSRPRSNVLSSHKQLQRRGRVKERSKGLCVGVCHTCVHRCPLVLVCLSAICLLCHGLLVSARLKVARLRKLLSKWNELTSERWKEACWGLGGRVTGTWRFSLSFVLLILNFLWWRSVLAHHSPSPPAFFAL